MRTIFKIMLLAATALASPARAQDAPDDQVVVTATRSPTPLDALPTRIQVIDRTEIEQQGLTTLPQALGSNAVQSGGVGATTSLFLRGANSNQTLSLFDGIRLNDPSVATGLYNFGQDTLGGLDRIEVVRGPLSTIYGSNAIGGAVNMIPRRGAANAFAPFGELEAGSFSTLRGLAGAAGTAGGFSYGVSYEDYHTDGFDQLPERIAGNNGESDGADIRTWTGSARYETSRFGIDLLARRRDARTEYDTGFPRAEDASLHQDTGETVWRLGADVALTDSLTARLSGGQVDGSSEDFDLGAQIARNDFNRDFADFALGWHGGDAHPASATLGLSWEREHADVPDSLFSDPLIASQEHHAAYVVGHAALGAHLDTTASARLDNYDGFGTHATYALGLVGHAGPARLYASYATAFRAPTLNERFQTGPFNAPNPDLDPEESRTWEIGADIALAHSGDRDVLTLGANYYQTRASNLIEYDFLSLQNVNINRASLDGVESYLRFAPVSWAFVRLAHDFTDARDLSAPGHPPLLRRPRDLWKLEAEAHPSERLGVHASWTWVGERSDFAFDDLGNGAFDASFVPGYNVGAVAVTYDATSRLQLFARVDNVSDQRYESTSGYAAAPRSAFVGVRARY
jgi:vitamin B12 transporter